MNADSTKSKNILILLESTTEAISESPRVVFQL